MLKNIYRILIFTLLWWLTAGCGNLVKLKLPEKDRQNPEAEWLELGKNPQHQHYANGNIAPPLDVVWKKRVKSVVADHPLALGDYIIASTRSGMMYVIDYESGEKVGNGKIGHALPNAPAIHDNRLYAGIEVGDRTLVGYNLEKSKRLWSESYPHISTSPLVDGDKIYFGTNRSLFFCAETGSGAEVWKYKTEAAVQSSPAQQGEFIVFGDNQGWLYSLNAKDGKENWKIRLEGSIFSHPVLDELQAFVGTVNGKMYSVSLYTGEIIWEKDFEGAIFGSPALYKNALYFGNNAHEVVALHKETGEQIWKFKTRGIVNTVPLPSPDYLYVASWDKNLYVLNRFSGKLVFKYELDKPVKSSPIIYRDYLILHTANDKLIALANEKLIQQRREQK